MYTDDDLDAAVTAGVLSSDHTEAFRNYVAGLRHTPAVDEEHFRLLTGFTDIFVTIALGLFLGALWSLFGNIGGAAATAVASWGLAEYFTRRRRMALPSIVLLFSFVGGLFALIVALATTAGFDTSNVQKTMCIAVAAAVAALGTYQHWRRFQVPITVAAGIAAGATVFIATTIAVTNFNLHVLPYLCVGAGLAIFAVAMRWDFSDPARKTRRADVAFWLHLLASPLLVHSVFLSMGLLNLDAQMGKIGIVFVLYASLALVAVIIDRRALMVSALAYVLYAMSAMFKEFGAVTSSIAITGIVVGASLLLLAALWANLRVRLVRRLPAHWQARLPPLAAGL